MGKTSFIFEDLLMLIAGGHSLGISVLDLQEYGRAEKCGESPTNIMLQALGQKNYTVIELYRALYRMKYFWAMDAIKSLGKDHVECSL